MSAQMVTQDNGHALLSPSGAHTWANCPGALQAQAGIEDRGSIFASEGTAAHELASTALEAGRPASEYIGNTIEADGIEFTVDEDMSDHVQRYIDYVNGLTSDLEEGQYAVAIEQRVETTIPECSGTADHLAYLFGARHLHVSDLKYGKGVQVFAADNYQALIYAWGSIRGLSKAGAALPDKITLHIGQPRLGHFDAATYSMDEFTSLIETINAAAKRALDPDDIERIPGPKQCQWCKAKSTCPELAEHTNATVTQLFPIEVIQAEKAPSPVDLGEAMGRIDMAKAWIKAVEETVFDQLSKGAKVEGYKLVEGRSSRKWGQSDEATKALLRKKKMLVRDITEPTLLSVAKLEKKLGKKVFTAKFADLVTKPTGKPAIAKESDKRPTINPSEQFEVLTESN